MQVLMGPPLKTPIRTRTDDHPVMENGAQTLVGLWSWQVAGEGSILLTMRFSVGLHVRWCWRSRTRRHRPTRLLLHILECVGDHSSIYNASTDSGWPLVPPRCA
eukprot:5076325-Amphidinium_carterae.1